MVYQLPHVPVSLIPSIDPLPDLFLEKSPTSMSESRMKISVLTDISILGFYGYIGYIGDISMDIFT